MDALLVGFGLGLFVAAQLGPMSLFLIRSTLRGSLATGLAIGGGVATVDTLYAALGVAGAAPLLTIGPVRAILGLVGAAVLVALGVRTLWTAFLVRLGNETERETSTPRRAFVTSCGATASNPLTIASWASIFAAASTAGAASTDTGALALVAGIGIGSLTAVTILALAVNAARARVGPRALATVDVVAGAGLAAFGGLLGHRTLQQET